MANLKETQTWESGIYQIEKTDPVVGGEDGISNKQAKQLANRTAYLKKEVETKANKTDLTTGLNGKANSSHTHTMDNITGLQTALNGKANSSHTHTMANITDLSAAMNAKANLASPTFTGAPKAPTPAQTVNDTTIATTAYVKSAIAALVGSAPAALDTLEELSNALAGDANLKRTLLTEIGKKANTSDFNNLKNLLVGIPFPYPLAAVPSGCLAFNGQAFNKTTYPILAQKYPSGVLPDLRGEFIRFWDNGRGVDAGRTLLSAQGDAIRNIQGELKSTYGTTEYALYTIGTGAFTLDGADIARSFAGEGISKRKSSIKFDASLVVPTADENRPRNIAFQAICLAA